MNVSQIKEMIVQRRLPWFIQSRLEVIQNRYAFYKNQFFYLYNRSFSKPDINRKLITFKCGFHGKSGGVSAIASIANMLTSRYCVEFVSYPDSFYNKLLNKTVRIVNKPDMNKDIFICDVSCEHSFFEELKAHDKKIIVSCHGRLRSAHGLTPEYVQKSLNYADLTHFVSTTQQESFQLDEGLYTIIPNATRPIEKTKSTNNVGTVGNLCDERKNAKETVDIALHSNADFIHLWGAEEDKYNNPKVKIHPWASSKEKIYNSFDVLVFMSMEENCPMVVLESLSAGIPCLLSSISAHNQFEQFPGVVIIDPSIRGKARDILNLLLQDKDKLKNDIVSFWKKNYSEEAIAKKWFEVIDCRMPVDCKST